MKYSKNIPWVKYVCVPNLFAVRIEIYMTDKNFL